MKLKDFFAKIQGSPEHEVAITAAQSQITALECERDELKSKLAAHELEISTHKDSIRGYAADVNAARDEAEKAKAEVLAVKAQAVKDLEAAKATIKAQVAQQALEITGQQVSAPVPAEKIKAEEKKNYTEQCREANAKRGK